MAIVVTAWPFGISRANATAASASARLCVTTTMLIITISLPSATASDAAANDTGSRPSHRPVLGRGTVQEA